MGPAEVEAFLTHLAVQGKVAASTQNQACSALLFLYKEVLGQPLPWLDNIEQAKRPQRLPVVLTHAEVKAVLSGLDGTHQLAANLLYESKRTDPMDIPFEPVKTVRPYALDFAHYETPPKSPSRTALVGRIALGGQQLCRAG